VFIGGPFVSCYFVDEAKITGADHGRRNSFAGGTELGLFLFFVCERYFMKKIFFEILVSFLLGLPGKTGPLLIFGKGQFSTIE
jgi:hypothetical protein